MSRKPEKERTLEIILEDPPQFNEGEIARLRKLLEPEMPLTGNELRKLRKLLDRFDYLLKIDPAPDPRKFDVEEEAQRTAEMASCTQQGAVKISATEAQGPCFPDGGVTEIRGIV